MLFIERKVIPPKPKYGKVIALTAVAVAAAEAAAFLGLVIAKRVADSKIEKHIYDEGFEVTMQAGEIPVNFKHEAEEDPTTEAEAEGGEEEA